MDIQALSPADLERFIHIQSVIAEQNEGAARVRDLRAYYDGDHPVMLTQRQQEYLGPLLTESEFVFAHNLVRTVIDTLRERLGLSGVTVAGSGIEDVSSDAPDDNAAAAVQLWQWWTANRLDGQQIRLYRRALRDGKAYAFVDYDEGNQRPRVTIHKVWDGSTGVVLHRDPSDANTVLFASRYFRDFDPLKPGSTGRERKTVYLPSEIRKYVRSSDGWQQIMDDGDTVWPLPWVDMAGDPLGVLVTEFENPGGSEVGQMIGLQNALNKSWLDLVAAADTSGFPLIAVEYARDGAAAMPAISDDDDIEGTDEFRISPGTAIEVDDARVHRLDAANLDPMINVMWAITMAIAGVTRTPTYYLRPAGGSDVPSGEALKQLESGIIKRAEERQLLFGQAWQDVFSLMWRVADTYGPGRLSQIEYAEILPQWKDPNVRNEANEANTAEAHKRLGVPDETVWQELGYTPEQIAQFKQDARQERAAEVASIANAIQVQQVRNAPQNVPASAVGQNGNGATA